MKALRVIGYPLYVLLSIGVILPLGIALAALLCVAAITIQIGVLISPFLPVITDIIDRL